MISPARFPNQKTSTDCLFMLSCALTPSLPLAHRCAPSPSATSPSTASLTSLSVSVHLPSSSLYAISAPHTDTSALLCLCLLHIYAPLLRSPQRLSPSHPQTELRTDDFAWCRPESLTPTPLSVRSISQFARTHSPVLAPRPILRSCFSCSFSLDDLGSDESDGGIGIFRNTKGRNWTANMPCANGSPLHPRQSLARDAKVSSRYLDGRVSFGNQSDGLGFLLRCVCQSAFCA